MWSNEKRKRLPLQESNLSANLFCFAFYSTSFLMQTGAKKQMTLNIPAPDVVSLHNKNK